jgi:hypothetical protein
VHAVVTWNGGAASSHLGYPSGVMSLSPRYRRSVSG